MYLDIGDRMNRQTIMTILKDTLESFINNNLYTEEEFESLINTIPHTTQDNNLVVLYEQEIITLLFTKVPYYQILPLLNDFQKTIKNAYQKNKKLYGISLLLSGCISELFDSIRERIRQEIYTHIYFALLNYYQNKDLILKESLFIKNLCDPSEISSLHVALQAEYKQNNLFDDTVIDLKEAVSKVNTKKKMILINNVKKSLIANFDKNERDDFED